MKEIAAILKKRDSASLAKFSEENTIRGNTPINEAVPSIFPNLDAYKEFLHEFCVNQSIKRVKEGLNIDDQISVYSNFIDVMDELMNSWFERVFELFVLYYPEASIKAADLPAFVKIETLDRKSLAKMFGVSAESMGLEFEKEDLKILTQAIETLKEFNEQKQTFIKRAEELISKRAPNTGKVAGAVVAAKLISLAGGLKRLALMPSSTIQVIGAEKALFRHLRMKAKPPKHGVIHESSFVSSVPLKHRGKMARALASKISIAAKVDYYKGKPVWESLIKSLEQKKRGLK